MSDDILSKLNQAFEQVEAGQLDEAIAILKPVLEAVPDNPDAWWIYMHAVSDPQEARRALQNVIRIAPDYPGASEMLVVLDEQYPSPVVVPEQRATVKPLAPPPMTMPEPPASTPERLSPSVQTTKPGMPSPFEQTTPPPAPVPARRRSILPTIAVVAVVLVAVILLIVLLNPSTPAPATATTEPTALVDVPTDTSLPVQIAPTVEVGAATEQVTAEATSKVTATVTPGVTQTSEAVGEATEAVGSLESALSAFTTAPQGVTTEELETGTTLVANICSAPGREARTLLPQVMEALAGKINALPVDAESIGTRLVNCANDAALVTVAVSREIASQFAQGDLSATDFSAAWVAIR